MLKSRSHKYCEIGSEILLLITNTLIQQFIREDYDSETGTALERAILSVIGVLVLINIVLMIYTIVFGCKESRHKKFLEKKRNENLAIYKAKSALINEIKQNTLDERLKNLFVLNGAKVNLNSIREENESKEKSSSQAQS